MVELKIHQNLQTPISYNKWIPARYVECRFLRDGFLLILSEAVQVPEVRLATADTRG